MNYIALTIGPIYKTLQNARKTREVWGGSYIFSYIMKNIIREFRDREFIVPYIKDEEIFSIGNEVGLFHDRFIFQAKENDIYKLKSVIDDVLSKLASETQISKSFLEKYFQIHYIEEELKKDQNPILELSPYLDTKELFYSVAQYVEDELKDFLTSKLNSSFLVKDAFNEKRKIFPSLPEIALYDLKDKFNIASMLKDDELEIYEDKDLNKSIKNHHKYIAIVQADGDNMGKVVESLQTTEDFNNFSKKLFLYCKESNEIIKEFGGVTIYAGGDDLLFFAPVVSSKETIFELCEKLSIMFNDLFKDENKKIKSSGKQATLSFGVSVTYYKYPLYEALQNAGGLLFYKAKEEYKDEKEYKGKKTKYKNNIAFKVMKHSGQTFETIVHKGNPAIYSKFLAISSSIQEGKDGVDNFLHSLHHKIDTHKTTLNIIAKDRKKLINFFANYFNKDEHKHYEEFFHLLVEYIYEVFDDEKIEQDDKLNLIYSTLRFVKFVKGDK